jgi:large subunit ribosomal protein L5e
LLSGSDIICQIVAAKITGDVVLTSAYAHELPRYGVKLGLTNFAAAYCVGLLCARRHLQMIGLDETYKGKEEVDGEMFEIEEDDDKRPFLALLDVGLNSCTTGNKVFSVMKGAVDGGINVPHNEKRFPAYSKEEGFDPEQLKLRILGNHISDYMSELMEEDEDRYNKQFSRYVAAGIEPDAIEDMYLDAHKAIRADPSFTKKENTSSEHNKTWRQTKTTYYQKKERIAKIKEAAASM